MSTMTCTFCGRPAHARGLCKAHYARKMRGVPVDTAIRPYVRRGRGSRYAMTSIDFRSVYVHREVAARELGRTLEPDEDVHHVNGDRSDNRPENLRVLSRDEHRAVHA
jgi:hypothetical protein